VAWVCVRVREWGQGCVGLTPVQQALAGRYNPKRVTVTGELSFGDYNCSEDGKVSGCDMYAREIAPEMP
jgi:hypothetical protein